MQNRFIKDQTQKGRLLYVRQYSIKNTTFAVLLVFREVSDSFLPPFLAKQARIIFASLKGSLRRSLVIFLILSVFAVFSTMYITSFWMVRPIRQFTRMVDFWDNPAYKFQKIRGTMRYSLMHMVELIERVRQKSLSGKVNVLEKMLPLKRGFDFAGINAGAFFVKVLEEKKDYYDLFRLDDNRIAIFMGEISGRGHDASMTTAKLYWTVRAYCRSFSTNPALVLSELNRFFYTESGSTALNVFLGFYDTEDSSLVFSQAGGLSLYRFDSANGTTKKYHLDIPPAGLVDPESYKADLTFARLKLEKGQVIGLLTDGILKLENFKWEEAATKTFAVSQTLGERLISFQSQVERAVIKGGQRDDIAGLFIEVPNG